MFHSDPEIQELIDQYFKAVHAVQSGIAAKMNIDPKDIKPKHLRTGINMAMVQDAALVALLIEKGIITHKEYYTSLLKWAQKEQRDYEEYLSTHYKTKITLV